MHVSKHREAAVCVQGQAKLSTSKFKHKNGNFHTFDNDHKMPTDSFNHIIYKVVRS